MRMYFAICIEDCGRYCDMFSRFLLVEWICFCEVHHWVLIPSTAREGILRGSLCLEIQLPRREKRTYISSKLGEKTFTD